MRRLTTLVLLSLALLRLVPAAGAASWILERGDRSIDLPITLIQKKDYVALMDVATFFELKHSRDRKRAILSGAQGNIELQANRALAMVNGQSVVLGAEVELVDGEMYVPADFLTKAIPRLLDVEARVDFGAHSIRFDAGTTLLSCETFDDRTRVTMRPGKPAALSEIYQEGQRRVIMIQNMALPAQVGGCTFDETLTDLAVHPEGTKTRLTFFVGPRFSSLKVMQVDSDSTLVFDFINDSGAAAAAAPVTAASGATGPEGLTGTAGLPSRGSEADVFDTVVIDAGHGGEDQGAVGPGGLQEKTLTLAVALETARLLRERGGLTVRLTREDDGAVGLVERTEIANRNAADLFLSIHANATPAGQATGAETYFLSTAATDEAARTIAARENDVTGLRGSGQSGGPLEILLWDLAQQQYLDESSRLAEVVQVELNDLAGTKDRGVKQANFLVLRGATMPAILVEVGFLSNPAEERRMRGAEFQKATAEALARAILAFRDERKARLGG